MSPLEQIDPRRICIIKPSALGDVVQTMSLLPVLRERFPAAQLSWVVNRELRDLLTGHPLLDEVIPFERRGTWSDWGRLLGRLRDCRFDLVFDLQGLLRTGVMLAATRAPLRVGLQTAREGSHLACHYLIPDSGRLVPAHLRYWRVAEELGMGERRSAVQFALSNADRDWVRQTADPFRGPLLVVAPGARWETKRWPVESFAVLACRAMRKYGYGLAVVGSPAEAELAEELTRQVRRFMPAGQVVNLAGQTTLKQLAGLMCAADVVVSNDSGPMHLASAVGTPVVSVFTCTSPIRSGPVGAQHTLIASRVPCAGSYCKRCPNRSPNYQACLTDVTIDEVWLEFCRSVERRHQLPRTA